MKVGGRGEREAIKVIIKKKKKLTWGVCLCVSLFFFFIFFFLFLFCMCVLLFTMCAKLSGQFPVCKSKEKK